MACHGRRCSALSSITHAFFQVEVRTLPAVKIKDVVVKTRIHEQTKKRQLV